MGSKQEVFQKKRRCQSWKQKKTLRNSNERMLKKKGVSPYYFTVLTYFPSPWFLSWLDVYYWWGRDISFWTLTTWLSWHLLWSLFEYRASCLAWILLLLALHVSLCFPWRGSSNDFYSYVLRNTPTERDRMFSASKQKLGKKGGIQSKSSLLSSITWVTPCFLFHSLCISFLFFPTLYSTPSSHCLLLLLHRFMSRLKSVSFLQIHIYLSSSCVVQMMPLIFFFRRSE